MTHLRAIVALTQHSVLNKANSFASVWSQNVLNVHLIRSLCTAVPPLSTVKRGRGRPRRSELAEDVKPFSVESGVDLILGVVPSLDEVYNETIQDAIEPTTPIVKRGPGRPRRINTSIGQDKTLLDAAISLSTDASSPGSKQASRHSTTSIPGLTFTHVDSSFEGRSTETSSDGIEYSGEWSNGKPHGAGQLVWPDGSSFEGHFVSGIRSGPGTLIKKWGIMSGNWVDDELEGEGEMIITGGTIYKGNFHKTRRHGRGTISFRNGTSYEGEHADGKREGYGTCSFADGSILTGEWKDDNANGEGTLVFANGKNFACEVNCYVFANIFFLRVLVSLPPSLNHFASCVFFLHQLLSLLLVVPSFQYLLLCVSAGKVYEGAFVDGKMHGIGRSTEPCGAVYVGEWQNGMQYGRGKLTLSSGYSYVGDWVSGYKHGEGTFLLCSLSANRSCLVLFLRSLRGLHLCLRVPLPDWSIFFALVLF